MRILLVITALLLSQISAWSQTKELQMQRTVGEVKVDGILNEIDWARAEALSNFSMLNPGNGQPEPKRLKSEVRLLFDDEYVYVGARLYDTSPDSILTQLTERDRYSENNDYFGIFINPFNDGLSDFNFWVTAAGVQSDSRTTAEGDDFGWNTVWYSKVILDSLGWVVEMAIPYQSLRFPDKGNGVWGLNMIRYTRRIREEYSWNFIDKSVGTYEQQCGLMKGMMDIQPPVRLSFLPYASTYVNEFEGETDLRYKLGLDLKYGIDQSFTLDMTLVPDFGQVAFDPQQLNLSPFELQFEENRPFFNEGIDLFSKGDLFYSRRIGGAPKNVTNSSVNDTALRPSLPEFTRLINAAKVSGRNKNNLGIGVFNAITDNNYQEFKDEGTGETSKILIEPLTNYTILVLDQRFNRNSSVAFINTSTWRQGTSMDANVTGLVSTLANKSNSWAFDNDATVSQQYFQDSVNLGYRLINTLRSTKGNLQVQVNQFIMSKNYDINDMGFQPRANLFEHSLGLNYRIFQPRGAFNSIRVNARAEYEMLYEPRVYSEVRLAADAVFVTRSFFAFGGNWESNPIPSHDYFEPRRDGVYWERPAFHELGGWISSDYRNPFALDMRYGYALWVNSDFQFNRLSIEPRYRFNDHFSLQLEANRQWRNNDVGWAKQQNDTVVFGKRDVRNTFLTTSASYVLNSVSSLSLDLRYVWSTVAYKQFYSLEDNGELQDLPTATVSDINFNTWNVDLRYSWWFAPASELVFLYRNAILGIDNQANESFTQNLNRFFDLSQAHNLSFRFTYFLDYNALTRKRKKRI